MPDIQIPEEFADDPVFRQEQEHLYETYQKLTELRDELTHRLEVTHKAAAQDLRDMSEEVTQDFGGEDEAMETLAAIETLNSVIDAYNQAHDFDVEKLRRVLVLLNQPYFAKVSLRMRPNRPPRDIYIGVSGVMDRDSHPVVIDWRSPVAETYYNQEMGKTSYEVNGKKREVELLLRRQFDLQGERLKMYFDTTVAIQDSLLLNALKQHHSEKLQAITATIQKEQNAVVRHEDIPVLLVNGIAGSGKTSVMLQRIAYLFYQQRDTLNPRQVYLFTPNAVFQRYIDTVLPSLGESNPQTFTWRGFLVHEGIQDRADGTKTDPEELLRMEKAIEGLELEEDDIRGIGIGDTQLIKASQVKNAFAKFPRTPLGPRLVALVKDVLHERLNQRLAALAKDEDVHEEMLGIDLDEQVQIFGEPINPLDEEDTVRLAKKYVEARYASARDTIEAAGWLRIDRIGQRLVGHQLNAVEYLYLRSLITGAGDRQARYVMVDEVQDYTKAQLMVMARYFSGAHFMLLGDEHQAIREGTATFQDMKDVFVHAGFGEEGKDVQELRLLTSYRSTPEITSLFMGLYEKDANIHTTSVQREGTKAQIFEAKDTESYLAKLKELVDEAHDADGLTALVCDTSARANWLGKQLGSSVRVMEPDDILPLKGVVVLDLSLAKGLEFDAVIIPDAQAEVYPATPLARRRLYTAVSRAMHKVTIVSQGEITELLRPLAAQIQEV